MPRKKKSTGGISAYDTEMGHRIQNGRREKAMSQKKLGDAIGVSWQTIQKWERGQNSLPIERLVQLAKILGLDVQALARIETLRRLDHIDKEFREPLLRFAQLFEGKK